MRRQLLALAVLMLFASSCTWITRVTFNAGGSGPLPHEGLQPELSEDGVHVVFESRSQLIAADTNGVFDVYWKNLETGDLVRLSVDSGGAQASVESRHPQISASGQFVLFWSQADLTGDSGGTGGLFMADTIASTLERIADYGTGGHSLSDDGRYVGFRTAQDGLVAGDLDGQQNFFIYDRQLDTHELVAGARQDNAVISGDGRYVVFRSTLSTLVANDTNGVRDLFRYDTVTDTYVRLSVDVFGGELTSAAGLDDNFVISADGSVVLFEIGLDLQVPGGSSIGSSRHLYLADVGAAATTLVNIDPGGSVLNSSSTIPIALSDDGTLALFRSDAGNGGEIFLRDIAASETTRPILDSDDSVMQGGYLSYPADLSGDGRYVTYQRALDEIPGQSGWQAALVVARVRPPTISSVSPAGATTNQVATLTILGSGFEPNSVATIVGSDSTVHSTSFVSEFELTVEITTGPTAGTFSIWVERPDYGPGFYNIDYSAALCLSCFSTSNG